MKKINVKDFSMAEFLEWLSENDEKIDTLELKRVSDLATCEIKLK